MTKARSFAKIRNYANKQNKQIYTLYSNQERIQLIVTDMIRTEIFFFYKIDKNW